MTAYASLSQLRARLGYSSTQTGDDAILLAVLEGVTKAINQDRHRRFQPYTATRYYTPAQSGALLVNDLLSVTSLVTDDDGDRTYENTWASTDYDLYPYDAASEDPPEPYWRIDVTPDGDYTFPVAIAKGVKITGTWGYYDQRTTSSATLAEALDATETGVDVSDGTQFSVGQTILIDSEQMYITAIATNTLTVRRGRNGATAATHDSGAAIQVYEYPIVTEACLLQAARLAKRKDAPFGVIGSADLGQQIVIARIDPDVRLLLEPIRHLAVG